MRVLPSPLRPAGRVRSQRGGRSAGARLRRRSVGGAGALLSSVLVIVALLVGCADNRITVEALREIEHELADVEPVAVEPEQLALTDLRPYTVGPGDVLALTFVGLMSPYSETKIQVRVHDDGKITLPLVGPVQVAGLDLQGVEEALHEAHVPKYVKALTVFAELAGPEGTTVVVTGAAREPGLVTLPGNQRNVLYALALSGGFVPGTSGRVRVRPIRPEREEVTYDLEDVNDLRRALHAPPLESGDMVIVEPAQINAIYVTGLFNAPQVIPVPPRSQLSVVRAVAAAGGLREWLDPQEATLWRALANGEQVRVKLDLAGILAGQAPDIALRAGDVLEVPHTAATRLREWLVQNVRLGPFSLGVHYDPLAQYNADRALERIDDGGGNGLLRGVRDSLLFGYPSIIAPPVLPPP